MNKHAIDTSALLIVLKEEPGMDAVAPLLPGALVSAVNMAECISVLVRDGIAAEAARAALYRTQVQIMSFDKALAFTTGVLIAQTRPFGLSLGDRACLALALRENLPVYTADRNWKNVNVGVEVNLVR